MNITRKPVIRVQVKLIPILFWPTWLATSPRVKPTFASPTGTSLMVPVVVAPGSPAACVAVVGALAAVYFSSAADGGVAASARATVLTPDNNTTAMAQI